MKIKPELISIQVSSGWYIEQQAISALEPSAYEAEVYEESFDYYFFEEMLRAMHLPSQRYLEGGWLGFEDPEGEYYLRLFEREDTVQITYPISLKVNWHHYESLYQGRSLQDFMVALNKVMVESSTRWDRVNFASE